MASADASPTRRRPRLVALQATADARYLDRVRALWAGGDAVLPLPGSPTDAQRLVATLRPEAALGGPEPPAGTAAALLPGDAALVVATSGSGDVPRGVVLSHGAVSAAVRAGNERLGTTADDRWLCCLPLHHIAGLLVLLRGEAASAPTVVHPGFDVEAIRSVLLASEPPTMVALVPTMLHRLLAADVPVDRFRRILLGGAAADPALLARARRAGARVVTSYGMTETCGGVVYDGIPLDGTAVAVDRSGAILLAGPTLYSGYRTVTDADAAAAAADPPAPGAPDRWLVTADRGRWRADGRLEILGRSDDVIVTGGENVSAAAVARALRDVPGVGDAAVVGVEDAEWGQRVEAWIVSAEPDLSLDAVVAAVRDHLPAPAVPKRLHRVAQLPRTALGKVARGRLGHLPDLAHWSAT